MNFTTETPTKPGIYAWKATHEYSSVLKRMTRSSEHAELRTDSGTLVTNMGGLWCRLVPAEEVEKAWRDGFSCGAYASRLTHITADGAFAESRAKRVMEGEE